MIERDEREIFEADVEAAGLGVAEVTPTTSGGERQVALLAEAKGNWLASWGLCAAILLLCLPAMLVDLGGRDSKHTMENIAVLSAQETWLRQRGYSDVNGHLHVERERDAWLMPTRNGKPRVTKPPLLVWLDLAAWADLEPQSATVDQLIFRARVVAVAMGLLLIASTFWAGLSVGDRKTAVLAALVVGSCWFVERQARTASYDIHVAAWMALSMAAALWAMRPLRERAGLARQVLGWGLGGVALGAAWMTKGPLALVVTLLPLAGVMIVAGGRRRSQIIGLLGMVALAAVVAGPWYVYAADLELNKAVMVWKREWGAKREEFQTPVYYVALLGLIAPWTIWLVAGLVQPFIRARQGARRQLLMAWLWFVTIFVFFSIPGAKQQRYILPIMPATALLVAQVWRFHQLRAEQGQVEQGIDLLRVPHWALLGVVSVGVGPVLLLQGSMVSWGWLTEQPAGPMGWPTVVAGSVVLMGLWWWGMRLHFRWQPLKAAVLTAVWSLVLMTLLWAGYSKSTTGVHPIKKEGQRIAGLVGAQPMYHLLVPQVDDLVNEEFLLYAKRIVPSLSPEQVREMSDELSEVTYLIAREDERHDSILERSGWQRVTTFNQDYELLNWLWVHEATGEDAAAAEGEGEQRKRETGAAG